MSTIMFIVLVRLLVVAIGATVKRSRAPKPKPLCTECVFAHVQYGACGRRVISCTFGGGVRPLKIDVLYCNDYQSRNVPVRSAIGFVRSIAPAEQASGGFVSKNGNEKRKSKPPPSLTKREKGGAPARLVVTKGWANTR